MTKSLDKNTPMMSRNCFKVLKILTTLILFAFFIGNSWLIFDHYIMKKTVTSSNMVTIEVWEQRMPAIVVCRENAFSDVKKDMSTLDNFLNNTLKLKYWLLAPNGEYLTSESTTLEWQYIYSFTRGLCVVLKYKPKVR